jgi:POT family proton-dependent oligopeptide transporter
MSDAAGNDKSFLGHPRALSTLFFTEIWERFSFYGMKAMLFLFIIAKVSEDSQSGLGIDEKTGGAIAGLYNSGVYLFALPGGWLADRLIGQRRAVLWGGIVIALGHFSMVATEVNIGFFYLGLLLIMIGTGLLKPNISIMVGDLYEGDKGARRDAGFSIFYMAINIGAFAAPLACGAVRQEFGWHWAFGLAGIGMTIGVVWYLLDQKSLGTIGLHPKCTPEEQESSRKLAVISSLATAILMGILYALHASGIFVLTWIGVAQFMGYFILVLVALFLGYVGFFTGLEWAETKKVLAIGILFVVMALFWSAFEQSSTSINVFVRDFTNRNLFGYLIPTEFLQAINPLFIIALSPVFAALWIRLGSKNLNPNIPLKFALGALQLSIAFLVLMFAAGLAGGAAVDSGYSGEQGKVLPSWLCLTYLLFTTGELCISPVGLSTITKLAPEKFASQMMGIWFIAAALGNLIAGQVGGIIENFPHRAIFQTVAIVIGVVGLIMLVFTPIIQKKMMGDVR